MDQKKVTPGNKKKEGKRNNHQTLVNNIKIRYLYK